MRPVLSRLIFAGLEARPFSTSSALLTKISAVQKDDLSRSLRVQWDDGRNGQFPYAWLRDNAPAPHTYNFGARVKARVLLMKDLDTQAKPSLASIEDDGNHLKVTWAEGEDVSADFTSDWLLDRNMGDSLFATQRRRGYHLEESESWNTESVRKVLDPPADFHRLLTDDAYLRDRLRRFLRFGIAHVTGVPAQPNQALKLGQRLGYLLPGHHGEIENNTVFRVHVEIDPCNLMNTPIALGLHTDFAQYQSAPDVQMLHVVKQAGEGGENQFCDGFRVAEQLKQHKPDLYDVLCTYPVEHLDWGEFNYKYQFASLWRTIERDARGNHRSIFFNNQVRSWFYDAPVAEIPKLLDGLKAFNDLCYHPDNMLEIKLNAGEMIWFANNRVLHGRSAFKVNPESGEVQRHLEGCYVSFDVLRSKIRVIDEQLGQHQHASY